MRIATAPSIAEGEIRAVFETSRCRSLPTTNSSRRSLRSLWRSLCRSLCSLCSLYTLSGQAVRRNPLATVGLKKAACR